MSIILNQGETKIDEHHEIVVGKFFQYYLEQVCLKAELL